MINGWWVALILLVILIGQVVACKRLKKQLQQAIDQSAHLQGRLSFVRTELAKVQTRRKKLLSASTQALIIVEKDHGVSSANKVAKRLFGKLDEKMSFTAWTRQHQLRELVDQTLQGRKMPPIYFSIGDKNLEARARVIKGRSPTGEKEVTAVALAIHDVTELQRLSRARRDFVANISHELRTPLASIQLLTETLLTGALDDQEIALNLIDKIAAQTDTLSQLAQELLDLSSIESGRVLLKMSPCCLRPIVEAQVESLLPQAERKNIRLDVDIADDVKVLVDETMIGRVVTNLIHNAIKFTQTGGVTVSTLNAKTTNSAGIENDQDDWVTVSVKDTGVGIGSDKLDRIFERFYKIDLARDRKQSGTGLGLAIAKHIVEAHGGHIWAESDGRTGTTFYFTLPMDE